MTNVEYETKCLIREIRKSNEYNQYQRLKKKLDGDERLMDQVNNYRKQCLHLQADDGSGDTQEMLARLRDENKELLSDSAVHEFLLAEGRLCRMMSKVMDSITDAVNLDLDFLDD